MQFIYGNFSLNIALQKLYHKLCCVFFLSPSLSLTLFLFTSPFVFVCVHFFLGSFANLIWLRWNQENRKRKSGRTDKFYSSKDAGRKFIVSIEFISFFSLVFWFTYCFYIICVSATRSFSSSRNWPFHLIFNWTLYWMYYLFLLLEI